MVPGKVYQYYFLLWKTDCSWRIARTVPLLYDFNSRLPGALGPESEVGTARTYPSMKASHRLIGTSDGRIYRSSVHFPG